MKEIPQISDAEWRVMKVFWASQTPLPSSAIIEALEVTTDWKPKTIHTLISRLVKKKALSVNTGSKTYLYFPEVTESDYKQAETKSFLQRVYNGSFKLMAVNFLKEARLSPEELEELEQILRQKRD